MKDDTHILFVDHPAGLNQRNIKVNSHVLPLCATDFSATYRNVLKNPRENSAAAIDFAISKILSRTNLITRKVRKKASRSQWVYRKTPRLYTRWNIFLGQKLNQAGCIIEKGWCAGLKAFCKGQGISKALRKLSSGYSFKSVALRRLTCHHDSVDTLSSWKLRRRKVTAPSTRK